MNAPVRVFTQREADAMLPRLEECLIRIQEKKQVYARRHDILFMHELIAEAERNQSQKIDAASDIEEEARNLEDAITKLHEEIHKIQALGCIVRNLDDGIVEFRGAKDGQEIFYVWKLGDKKIQYYRTAQSTMNDRILLTEELQ